MRESSITLPRTSPPVVAAEPDDHSSSSGHSGAIRLHTIYVYRNICMICMIALMGSKLATSYRGIGSRVKHRGTEMMIRSVMMISLCSVDLPSD